MINVISWAIEKVLELESKNGRCFEGGMLSIKQVTPTTPNPISFICLFFRCRLFHYSSEGDINVEKEQRIQNHMILMVVLFAVCWLPINILIIVTHFVYETSDNSQHFDITFMTLTLVGYMSTCANPALAVVLNPKIRERVTEFVHGKLLPASRPLQEHCTSVESWSLDSLPVRVQLSNSGLCRADLE